MFHLERNYVQEMIAHARAEAPNECCGLLAGSRGRVRHLYQARNADHSPVRYSVDPKELFGIIKDLEGKGWELLGIYHSHTHTRAYPSATDVKLAFWPDCLYFVISLERPEQPILRAFHIIEGKIEEEQLQIS